MTNPVLRPETQAMVDAELKWRALDLARQDFYAKASAQAAIIAELTRTLARETESLLRLRSLLSTAQTECDIALCHFHTACILFEHQSRSEFVNRIESP